PQRRTRDGLLAGRAEPLLRRRVVAPADRLGVEGALQERVDGAGERHRAVEQEALRGGDRGGDLVAAEEPAHRLLERLEAPARRVGLSRAGPQLLAVPPRRAAPALGRAPQQQVLELAGRE